MSDFTQFKGELFIKFNQYASDRLRKTHWEVTKGFTYYIGYNGSDEFVRVPKGYLTDGVSVPRLGRIFINVMGRHSQAAVVHDWMCDYYIKYRIVDGVKTEVPVDRKEIDLIFYEALKVSGVSLFRRTLIRAGVDLYRWIYRPKKPNKISARKLALERSLKDVERKTRRRKSK